MTMTYLWTGMIFCSVLFGFLNNTTQAVSNATLEGATSAVTLCISLTGTICLWTGIMEVLRQCGLAEKLAKLLSPLLGALYPDLKNDPQTMGHISANFSANLLGLGNAATPLGLQAVKGLSTHAKGVATPSLCLFVVCNTASIQLIPTTIASLRSATGSQSPFEIMPAVWITSLLSLLVGISACKIGEKILSKKEKNNRREPS